MRSMIIDYSSYRKSGDTLSFSLTKLSLTITVLCFIPESLFITKIIKKLTMYTSLDKYWGLEHLLVSQQNITIDLD